MIESGFTGTERKALLTAKSALFRYNLIAMSCPRLNEPYLTGCIDSRVLDVGIGHGDGDGYRRL